MNDSIESNAKRRAGELQPARSGPLRSVEPKSQVALGAKPPESTLTPLTPEEYGVLRRELLEGLPAVHYGKRPSASASSRRAYPRPRQALAVARAYT